MSIPFTASAQKNQLFAPTMIPSLSLWFDASDPGTITQSGGLVSEWRDKSSNAYSVIQGTASNRPTYATNLLNGLPGIQLSATSYLYQVGSSMPNFTSGSATTAYMVAKNGSSIGNGWNIINTVWFTGINNATTRYHFSFGYGATNGITLYTNGNPVANPGSYVVPYNTNAIMGFAASATSNYIFYNGSNTAYASSGAPPSANNTTWFLFGDARVSPNPIVTDENIYEFVGFNTVLTTAQQQFVEGYLAWKWGLQSSLSNGHPYKTTPLYTIPSLITPATYPTSALWNPEFEPRLIPGCILWLDGADPNGTGIRPANGATLTSWKDKSISNFPFTSVGSSYNTTAVNSLPGIDIGTNFFGYDPGSAQNNWQEVFAVGIYTGASPFNTYNGFVTSSVDGDGGSGGGIIFIGNSGTTSWYPIGNTYTTPVLNGTQTYTALPTVQSGFVVRTLSATAVNLRGLRFGVDRSNGRQWIGFISEVICYNTALSTIQRQQVEAYLAYKWKLTSVLSTQNIYAPGSYLTFVNAPLVPLPPRRAIQGNKFLPPQYSNCVLWLDAADRSSMTVSGTSVTQWNDKSGAGNNVASGNITGTLTYSASSRSISTAGTSNYFFVPVDSRRTVSPNLQVFIVYSWLTSSAGTNQALWGDDDGGWNRLQLLSFPGLSSGADSFALSWGNQGTGLSPPPNGLLYTGLNTAAKLIYHASYNQYTTNGSVLYLNGANQGSFTDSSANPQTALTNTWFAAIGPASGGAYPSQIEINEIVMYTTTLTTQQRQQLEGYFAWKWGLKASLGSGHPFFFIPPLPLP